MEYMGMLALILLLCYAAYPGKVKRLEANVKKLERKQRGENLMSKLMSELVGKECKLECDEALPLTGSTELHCLVLDCDDEWLKVRFANKKKETVTRLLRIENIKAVEIAPEQ